MKKMQYAVHRKIKSFKTVMPQVMKYVILSEKKMFKEIWSWVV
jgi:hypothetical protein